MKTRTFTLIILSILGFSLSSNAQWHIGANAGLSSNNVTVSGLPELVPNAKAMMGYKVGLNAEYDINQTFSLLSGMDYTQRGFVVQEGMNVNILGIDVPIGVKVETRVQFIEMPILGKFKFGEDNLKAYVLAGPSISYATTGQIKTKASLLFDINVMTTDINLGADAYNRKNIGAVIGAGIEIPNDSGKFFADVRYNHSLTNMLNDPVIDVKLKPYGVSLGIGYAMAF
jgi:hypothetical protein